MKTIIIAFLGILVPMLILDAAWLSLTVKSFYAKHIGELMAPSPSLAPAAVFYILYALALIVFVILPAMKGDYGLGKVFLFGALFGLVAYGTYDLTNQATLKTWSTTVTIVDMLWGAFITGTASTISVWITRMLG